MTNHNKYDAHRKVIAVQEKPSQQKNLSGIELFAIERARKIKKHGYDAQFIKDNPHYYSEKQLAIAAEMLLMAEHQDNVKRYCYPTNWPIDEVDKMLSKSYLQRLIIAGSLIADETERIQNQNKTL